MKRNHKVYLRITIFLILLYVGLLFVLYLSEHAHSAAAESARRILFWCK